MSHSSAPWTFSHTLDLGMSEQDDPNGVRMIEDDKGRPLLVGSKYYPSTPDDLDDWHLIAAAPDLLAECKALRAEVQSHNDDYHHVTSKERLASVDAVIAKAEGR
jgi:hypothetical protein